MSKSESDARRYNHDRGRIKYARKALIAAGYLIEIEYKRGRGPERCDRHDMLTDRDKKTAAAARPNELVTCWGCVQEAAAIVGGLLDEYNDIHGIPNIPKGVSKWDRKDITSHQV